MQAALASRIALAALALTFSVHAGAERFYGTVVAVADGDTLTILDELRNQHRVRLSAIDAPERRQPYGESAKRHLVRLVHGKSVLVDWHKRDRYGRVVGRVLIPECARAACSYTKDAALEQLKAGLAWHFTRYAAEQPSDERARYAAIEQEARVGRQGLWQQAEPVPPWIFRRSGRDVSSRDGPGVAIAGPPG